MAAVVHSATIPSPSLGITAGPRASIASRNRKYPASAEAPVEQDDPEQGAEEALDGVV